MSRTKHRDLPITERELEVLRLIALGYTDREIADLLDPRITPKTARTHTANLLRRMGAANRSQAVAMGYEQGLLP